MPMAGWYDYALSQTAMDMFIHLKVKGSVNQPFDPVGYYQPYLCLRAPTM